MAASLLTPRTAGEFAASVGSYGQIAFVTVEGPLDFFTAPGAQKLLLDLLEQEPRQILIDVHEVFVDSSGIGILVHVAQRARQERRHFRLICHQRLAEVLRLHGLDDVLGVNATSMRSQAPQPDDQTHLLAA